MKKILALFIFFTCAFGSDPISFDSLFKKQIGLRSNKFRVFKQWQCGFL